jgi:MtN3 and saliva related transmembrane protein
MDLIFVIGVLAVITTGLRLLPQIVKSFKTKKVRDVSLLWEIIGGVSSILWLIYAYLRGDMILLTAGIVLLISYGILIFQKFIYSQK